LFENQCFLTGRKIVVFFFELLVSLFDIQM